MTVDQNLSAGGGQTAGHNVHGGGFACAVGPQKAVDLAGADGDGQI